MKKIIIKIKSIEINETKEVADNTDYYYYWRDLQTLQQLTIKIILFVLFFLLLLQEKSTYWKEFSEKVTLKCMRMSFFVTKSAFDELPM